MTRTQTRFLLALFFFALAHLPGAVFNWFFLGDVLVGIIRVICGGLSFVWFVIVGIALLAAVGSRLERWWYYSGLNPRNW